VTAASGVAETLGGVTGQQRARVLSGIQPTGRGAHLGNYLGAVRQWIALQDSYDAFYFLPDMHAITVPQDPAELRRRTLETAAELMAAGLDPARCTLFVQSQVPQHAALAWVMNCLTGFGEARRMTQFKDKSGRDDLGSASVGLFTYPMLQAADILLYQADHVPVGADQRQHLELTRTLAQRFNTRFGHTFTVPTPYVVSSTERIADLADPTRKMSKSLPPAGTLDLLDPPEAIRKKIRSAVTDTGREVRAGADKPGVTNLLTIAAAVSDSTVEDWETRFEGAGYGDFKAAVAEAVAARLAPIRERYTELMEDPAPVLDALAAGAARATAVAETTMADVRERVGWLAGK
jgi:tryptophanyl-tRNA synthetase